MNHHFGQKLKKGLTRTIFFVVCLFYFNKNHAQSNITDKVEPNSFSLNILGSASYAGVTYERLIEDRFSLEIGVGLIGYGFGVTYFPIKKVQINQLNPYVGIKYTNHAIIDGENKSATYLPIGLTYVFPKKMQISFDVGPSFFNHKSPGYRPTPQELLLYPYTRFGVWGNLKFGFRFAKLSKP